jgi:hypothetical protein
MAVAQSGPNLEPGYWQGAPAVSAVPSPAAPMPGGLTAQATPLTTTGGQATPKTTGSAPGEFPVVGEPLWVPEDEFKKGDTPFDETENHYGPGPTPYRLWADAEYLLFWVKPGLPPPPLVTTGPASSLGILGQPGTNVLFSNELDYDEHSGGRVTIGYWLDKGGQVGVEAVGFLLENKAIHRDAASDATGLPLLARPAVNAVTGQEGVTLISFPGAFTGDVGVSSTSQVYGAEANFIGSLCRGSCWCADMVIGFRYVGLSESLGVVSDTVVGPTGLIGFNGAPAPVGSTVTITDRFETRNDFYGGQVGGRTLFHWNKFFASLQGKLAVGNTHEVVNTQGSTVLTGAGVSGSLPGGLLAVASNSGLRSRDEFTFIPEAAAKVGYNITDCISVFVGYTFLYWYDVARPSEQIDRVVNPGFVPSNLTFGSVTGPIRPIGEVNKTDFWMQGISFGVEVRY